MHPEDAIHYFSEDREVPQITSKTSNWITELADFYGFKIESINYIFCSDEHLLNINKEYLNHDYYTDIITFDTSEEVGLLESDIFISLDRVAENEVELNVPRGTELIRVMAHGVLHLCGFKDKTELDSQKMRAAENDAIKLWEEKYK
jgi:probable rRNA maturation factor